MQVRYVRGNAVCTFQVKKKKSIVWGKARDILVTNKDFFPHQKTE